MLEKTINGLWDNTKKGKSYKKCSELLEECKTKIPLERYREISNNLHKTNNYSKVLDILGFSAGYLIGTGIYLTKEYEHVLKKFENIRPFIDDPIPLLTEIPKITISGFPFSITSAIIGAYIIHKIIDTKLLPIENSLKKSLENIK
jgi:hypothetical protein